MDPQEFLAERIHALRRVFTGNASPNEYIDNVKAVPVPGIGLLGKAGLHGAHQILKSAGTGNASKMSTLGIGGDAPVYGTPFNDVGSYEARVK